MQCTLSVSTEDIMLKEGLHKGAEMKALACNQFSLYPSDTTASPISVLSPHNAHNLINYL